LLFIKHIQKNGKYTFFEKQVINLQNNAFIS